MASMIPAVGDPPLLRAPPYFGAAAAVSHAGSPPAPMRHAGDAFALIREARVGGAFWAAPWSGRMPATVVKVGLPADLAAPAAMLGEGPDPDGTLWLLPAAMRLKRSRGAPDQGMMTCDLPDPWSLLRPGMRLVVSGDDEWAALGHIAGCEVVPFAPGRFATPAGVRAHLAATAWRDPFTGAPASLEQTVALLADWRRVAEGNRGIVAACGIAWWKRREIAGFLRGDDAGVRFFRSERRAICHAVARGGAIAAWPSRVSAGLEVRASQRGVPVLRIEDGFVRSVGLGSQLVPPSSITLDRLGAYYDPARASDLEALLASAEFAPALLARAEALRRTILAAGIGKYGIEAPIGGGREAGGGRSAGDGRRIVLVPGQVEDDVSVRSGGAGVAGNLDLLARARAAEPGAELWYRPHPDVDAGHRRGAVADAQALVHADRIARGGGMATLLAQVDAVHVLTSLTGFEALLRGRDVTCHGVPFYAGWGLTRDLAPVPARRGRRLTLAELVAATLILYPRYLDPVTGLPCPPEVLVARMTEGAARNRLGWVSRLRAVQGRLMRRRR